MFLVSDLKITQGHGTFICNVGSKSDFYAQDKVGIILDGLGGGLVANLGEEPMSVALCDVWTAKKLTRDDVTLTDLVEVVELASFGTSSHTSPGKALWLRWVHVSGGGVSECGDRRRTTLAV